MTDVELDVRAVITQLLERGKVDRVLDTFDEVHALLESIKEAERRLERSIHVRTLGLDEGVAKEVCVTAWLCQPVDWERACLDG